MTENEKPNSVCKGCQQKLVFNTGFYISVSSGSEYCPSDGSRLGRKHEPVAESAEPPCKRCGAIKDHPNHMLNGHHFEPAEPSASPQWKRQESCSECPELIRAAPQPVAGEGPPKFFDGELMPIHWCPGLKKFVCYPSLFCLKHNRGSGEVDYVPVTSEGTPKLEDAVDAIMQLGYTHDRAWQRDAFRKALRPFITPACSPPEIDLNDVREDIGDAIQALRSGWPANDVIGILKECSESIKLATPASAGEANHVGQYIVDLCSAISHLIGLCEAKGYTAADGRNWQIPHAQNIVDRIQREYFGYPPAPTSVPQAAKCNCIAMALSGNGPMTQDCPNPNCQYYAEPKGETK